MRTTLSQLRTLLSEASREGYRQRLLRWFADSDDERVQWMVRNGYAPVPRGDKGDLVLGWSANAIAYGAIDFNNRYVVVKFIPKREFESYEKLKHLRDMCPNVVKRHLLEVLHTEKIEKIDEMYDALVVVEPLVPMTRGDAQIWDDLEGYYFYDALKQRIKAFLHDRSRLDDIVQDVLDECYDKSSDDKLRTLIVDMLVNTLQNYIDDFVDGRPPDKRIDELINDALCRIEYKININIIERISNVMFNILIGDIFPNNFNKKRNIELRAVGINRGMRSLLNALQYLVDHFGFLWLDLSNFNVMIRPSTGEYVASDIGEFMEK